MKRTIILTILTCMTVVGVISCDDHEDIIIPESVNLDQPGPTDDGDDETGKTNPL